MARVAACVIVGDGETNENWNRMVDSLRNHVKRLFVGYTGNKNKFPYATEDWVTVKHIGWENDFSIARNANFDQVRDATINGDRYDWILWIDSDDTLEDGEHLQRVIAESDSETQVIFLPYIYAFDKNTGRTIVTQWRERLIRTDVEAFWEYVVHEICHLPPGTQARRVTDGPKIRHWRFDFGQDDMATRKRNRELLTKAHKDYPHEPRYVMYLAHEIYAEGQYRRQQKDWDSASSAFKSALQMYEIFLKAQHDPTSDDPYSVVCRMAEITTLLGDLNAAVDRYLQGVKMRPTYPDAYIGIAECFLASSQYALARDWANMAMNNINPEYHQDTFNAVDSETMAFAPYYIRGIARQELGDLLGAREDYDKAIELQPTHPELPSRLANINSIIDNKEKQVDERKPRFGSSPDKSIAFVVPPIFEPWHPKLAAEGGVGGAERCVMELAKRFAEDGWRTVVFGTPGIHRGVHDGVEYWDTLSDFNATERFKVMVASRYPALFSGPMNAEKKIVWLHDVNVGPQVPDKDGYTGLHYVDHIVALTNWHARHTRKIYLDLIDPDKLEVIHNGYDPTMFGPPENEDDRNATSFIYASSPDRGVDTLLSMWPDIKKRWPESTLDVYYGWTGIDKILARDGGHPLNKFKSGVLAVLDKVNEDGSIHWHDRVSHADLAKMYRKSNLWLYPTAFMETFCITAVEMQACGVIPVTSQLAALRETVAAKHLLIPGPANNATYQDIFLRVMTTLLEKEGEAESIRQLGYDHVSQFTWDEAYVKWRNLVNTPVRSALTV